jgi:peptidoglycan/xylan/chitin deacetylase (PgdA/CDA1 family)
LNPKQPRTLKKLNAVNSGTSLDSLHLLYHELRPSKSNYSYVVSCEDFEKHTELFARLQQAKDCKLRPEITFDDGHISNHEYALPMLQSRGVQARFFITVGWTGQRPGYMDWHHLRALNEAGQLIGAHGWSHTLLTHCTPQALQLELNDARHALEDKLGTPITTMSLPGGRFDRRILAACQEAGYTEVFTSIPRKEAVPLGSTVGRLNIRGDMNLPWIEDLLKPESSVLAKLERQDRIKSAAKSMMGDRLYARVWALLNRQEPETDLDDVAPSPGKTFES